MNVLLPSDLLPARQRRLLGLGLAATLGLLSLSAQAQRGRNGTSTVSTAGALVNDYTPLANDVAAGNASVTVVNAALNTGNRFNTGALTGNATQRDLVMVIQMQGASINPSNSAAYGSVTNFNSAGRYEIMEVQSVSGNTITFTCSLRNSYSVAGHTQIVRIPRYSSLTVNSGASITAPAWNGSVGGVVAVEVEGTTTINGSVSATGLGFRGGAVRNDAEDAGGSYADYVSPTGSYGGEKGESIAGYQTDYDALNGRYGRGAPANGGGGGNSHNCAGGGGANAGAGTWTGTGNPDRGSSNAYDAAWNLEGSGFATSTSSGGGRGGYSYASSDQNALLVGPGNSAWGGNQRRNFGGLGGHPLEASQRLFLGGGGGAGNGNNNGAVSGGAGGGLVYLLTFGPVSGSGSIQANGTTGFRFNSTTVQTANGQDAGGGGGGGGTIVLNVTGAVTGINAVAQGGAGASQAATGVESEGPGGGGGGGLILYANNSGTNFTRSVANGPNGVTTSPSLAEFPPNGSTAGGSGSILTFLPNAQCAVADVTTTLTPISNPTFAGQTGGFTVTFQNTSSTYNANDIFARVQLPTGLSNLNVTGAAAYSYDSSSGLLTYTGLTGLSASQTYSSTISFVTPATATVQAISAVSTSTDQGGNSAPDFTTSSYTVTPIADVTTTISGQAAMPRNSVSGTYTVNFTNNGPSTAAAVTRTVTLPQGATTNATLAPGATISTSGSGNNVVTTLTYAPGDLTVGSTASYSFAFNTPNNAVGSAANITSNTGTSTLQAVGGGPGASPDSFTLNATISGSTTDLSTTITAASSTVFAGQTGQFTVTFANSTGAAASNTVRQVQLPASLNGVSFLDNGAATSNWNYNVNSGLVTYTGGAFTLATGTSRTLTISFPAPVTASTISATSTISSSDVFDSNQNNNSASAGFDVTPAADMVATLNGPASAPAGSILSYSATVTNNGPAVATSPTASVQLVPGLFNVTGGNYNFDTGLLTLTLPASLASGEAQTLPISFQLPNNNQPVSGRISAASSTADVAAANNNGTAAAANVTTTTVLPTGSCGGVTAGGSAATQGLYTEYFNAYHGDNMTFFNGRTVNLARSEGTPNHPATNDWGNLTGAVGNGTATDPNQFSARMQGLISITTPGTYTFSVNSDDGSYLWVGNAARDPQLSIARAIVNNGGGHGPATVSGNVTLQAGNFPILLVYGEIGGGNVLSLSYSGPDTGGSTVLVPQSVLCATRLSAALPVTLTRFEAKAHGLDAQLTWTTAQEKNNRYFQVERALDGSAFEPVQQVAGAGTTTAPRAYAHLDAGAGLLARTAYYRLKQVDYDGTFAYSTVQAVRFADVTDAVLYPNPATEQLLVRLPASADALTALTVYSALGQQLLHQPVEARPEATLDVRRLPAGTYLLRLHTASGKSLTRRFVKQ